MVRRLVKVATRRKARDWAEVARWLNVFWGCRCRYYNVASYRCFYCGSRAPAEVRTLVAETLDAADRVEVAPKVPLAAQP